MGREVFVRKLKKIKSLTIGLIIIAINSYWIWHNLRLKYLYSFLSLSFFIMVPDWLLFINVILGIIGIYIGFETSRKNLSIKKGVLLNLFIWFLSAMLNFFVFL